MPLPLPPYTGVDDRHWLACSLEHFIYPTRKEIILRTDASLLIFLFWHLYAPAHEPRVTMRRGVPLFRDPHISFHPWGWIIQEEPGHSTTHTFIINKGDMPTKIWFRFERSMVGTPRCPSCGSPAIGKVIGTDTFCNTCHLIFPGQNYTQCPNCGSKNLQKGWPIGAKCFTCEWEGQAEDLDLFYERISATPFFFQEWFWLPEMELLYHEPWTYQLFDLNLLYHEPWTYRYPEIELLFYEPWSTS